MASIDVAFVGQFQSSAANTEAPLVIADATNTSFFAVANRSFDKSCGSSCRDH